MTPQIIFQTFFSKDSLLIWVTVLYNSLFFYLNKASSSVFSPQTVVDNFIPFVPVFVVPYLSYHPYPFISLLIFSLYYKKIFKVTLFASWLLLTVSFLCFYFFPSMITRPIIANSDIFSQIVGWLYSIDKPYAALPSLHAGLSTLSIVGWALVNNRLKLGMIAWGLLIICSTVLVKQHYFLDILAGIILALISFFVVYTIQTKSKLE